MATCCWGSMATAYCDFWLVCAAILPGRKQPAANRLLRQLDAPLAVNQLHLLQLEMILARAEPAHPKDVARARAQFKTYLEELVFEVQPSRWEAALALAVEMSRRHPVGSASPTHLLHPCLAATAGFTHYASFEPEARRFARAAGLRLLPTAA